ncbi:hypothetical protein GCM10017706_30010 [Lactococcus lactis subsp. hordniae]
MFKKSDKKIKENDQESNAAFEEFFNQVLKKMPARSAKIISSSLTVSKAKAEQFLDSNSQKFAYLFDEFWLEWTVKREGNVMKPFISLP